MCFITLYKRRSNHVRNVFVTYFLNWNKEKLCLLYFIHRLRLVTLHPNLQGGCERDSKPPLSLLLPVLFLWSSSTCVASLWSGWVIVVWLYVQTRTQVLRIYYIQQVSYCRNLCFVGSTKGFIPLKIGSKICAKSCLLAGNFKFNVTITEKTITHGVWRQQKRNKQQLCKYRRM